LNPRNTGILALLAAALAAFVYFYELGGEDARKQAEDDTKRLFPGLEVEALEFIELTTSDERSVRLERDEGGFGLVLPFEFPADTFNANALASGLVGLKSERKLENPQPLDVYGLASSASLFSFGAGAERHGISIGKDAPVGGNRYVSVLGSEDVHLVKSFSVRAFEKTLDDLRRKRVAPFDRDSIDRIELHWRDAQAVLERAAEGWLLREPLRGPADAEAVDKLISDLSYLRAEGFVDAPSPDDEASLAVPDFAVRLSGKTGAEGDEPFEVELTIGQPVEGGSRLVEAGLPALFRISAVGFESLPSELTQLRFRTLAKFDSFDAERLEIVFHASEPVVVTARRTDEGWVSESEPVAPESLSALVRELSDLKAADILAERMGPVELRALELEPPVVTYRVLGAGGASPRDGEDLVLLGEVLLGGVRDADGRTVAQAAGSPIVYALEASFAEAVPISLDAFRERFVVKSDPEIAPPAESVSVSE